MARKTKRIESDATASSNGHKRTRIMPEFTLIADNLETDKTVELAKVKGTSAAKAVYNLATQELADKYKNFRHVKMSTVNFDY